MWTDPIDNTPSAVLSTFLPFSSERISGRLFISVEPGMRLFDFLPEEDDAKEKVQIVDSLERYISQLFSRYIEENQGLPPGKQPMLRATSYCLTSSIYHA